jgi:CheY-like chemotaxis protein
MRFSGDKNNVRTMNSNSHTNLLVDDTPATAATLRVSARMGVQSIGKSILIVDDDPDALRLLEYLMAMEGYAVSTADGSAAAIELLNSYTPDAMLMDIRLPGVNGLQLTRLMKLTAKTEKVPILAVSTRNTPLAIQEAYDAGCDGYITKPVDPMTFASTVGQYLESDSNYLDRLGARRSRSDGRTDEPDYDFLR